MTSREEARRAADALMAQARRDLARRKKARLQRAYRHLRLWESPLIPAAVAAVATCALDYYSSAPLLSIAIGIAAGYLYALLGRRSARDAIGRIS